MNVRVLIADGDSQARGELRSLLGAYDWLDTPLECSDGQCALNRIERERPDLLFVADDLAPVGGLELIAMDAQRGEGILLSAAQEQALPAFDVGAFDFLMKPLSPERVAQSMLRFRRQLLRRASGQTRRLFLRIEQELVQIDSDEISRIEACGDYVNLHARDARHLIRLSLKEIQRRIDPAKFLQIHRSHLINLDHVQTMRPYDDRRFLVALSDGSQVVASRSGTRLLKRLMLD